MLYSTLLTFSAIALAAASPDVTPVDHSTSLVKRDVLCSLFGICNLLTDTSNCGIKGRVCAQTWPNGGSGAVCNNGVCGASSCPSLYDFNWSTLSCQNVASDVNNCGACGTICSVTGASSTKCSVGQCVATACSSGYTLSSGSCIKTIDTTSDVNNCGARGNVCPTAYLNGSGSVCLNSVCQPTTCNSGYAFNYNSKACQNVQSDASNCGAIGNVCSFANGSGYCKSGTCTTLSCNAGYQNVNGVCTYMNLSSDSNNCGSVGNVCKFTNGVGSCKLGSCVYSSCNSGYQLTGNACSSVDTQTDVNNCGKVGQACPASYLNGGAAVCSGGVCSTTCNHLYAWDSTYSYCRNVGSDVNNCGAVGKVCSLTGSASTSCMSGVCISSACVSGYTLTSGTCVAVNTQSDPNNCGSIGNTCVFNPTGAAGTCSSGKCVITSCPSKYTLNNGVCVLSASGKARLAKKDKVLPKRTLCPTGETACPIIGSASYNLAVTHHFTADNEISGVMAGSGGYECLDTQQSLESCGGCASTGEGQDCTKIRGAVGVGCDAGSCVVFSCQAGWRPNLAGTKCVRTHTDGASNSTRSSTARRHIAARGAHAHHHAHGHS